MSTMAHRLRSAKISSGSLLNDSVVPKLREFADLEDEIGKVEGGGARLRNGLILQRYTADLSRVAALSKCRTIGQFAGPQRVHSAKITNGSLQHDSSVPKSGTIGLFRGRDQKISIWNSQVPQRPRSAEIHSGSLKNESPVPNLNNFVNLERLGGIEASFCRGRHFFVFFRMTALCHI